MRDNGRKLVKVADYDLSQGAHRRPAHLVGAARLAGAHLVRLQEGRRHRRPRHEHAARSRRSRSTRRSRTPSPSTATASTSPPTSACTASTPAPDNKPVVDWKVTYKNSGIHKPSQVNAGHRHHADDLQRRRLRHDHRQRRPDERRRLPHRREAAKGEKRVVCETPVFGKGASATENSIIAAGRSLFVENNYGYQDPFGPNADAPTTAGFARVDVNAKGSGCKVRWTNKTAPAPTVVSKLSTKTGLIYTYIAPDRPQRPAAVVLGGDRRQAPARRPGASCAGTGLAFNNNYAGLSIGPDGTAYLGTFGGLQALRDGNA